MAKQNAPGGGGAPRLAAGWIVALAAAVVALGLVAFVFRPSGATTGSAPAAAPLEVDPAAPGALASAAPTIDLGRVPFDKQVVADFELINTGGTPVKLTSGPTVAMLEGCWPAAPAVGSTVIQAGGKTTIRYPFQMHAGMGGPHRIQITLQTDSPRTPTVTLELRAIAG